MLKLSGSCSCGVPSFSLEAIRRGTESGSASSVVVHAPLRWSRTVTWFPRAMISSSGCAPRIEVRPTCPSWATDSRRKLGAVLWSARTSARYASTGVRRSLIKVRWTTTGSPDAASRSNDARSVAMVAKDRKDTARVRCRETTLEQCHLLPHPPLQPSAPRKSPWPNYVGSGRSTTSRMARNW